MASASPTGRYITGLTRSRPVLAPLWCRSSNEAPPKFPPTFPPLARNSSMIGALKSLTSATCPPLPVAYGATPRGHDPFRSATGAPTRACQVHEGTRCDGIGGGWPTTARGSRPRIDSRGWSFTVLLPRGEDPLGERRADLAPDPRPDPQPDPQPDPVSHLDSHLPG